MSIQSTNFIQLIESFKYSIFDYNYVLLEDIREILINHFKDLVREGLFFDEYQFIDDEKHNLKEFIFYDIKELIPDLLKGQYERLQEKLTDSHSNLFNYVNDLNIISKSDAYNEFEGNPFQLYCQCVADFIMIELEGTQDYIIQEQKLKAVQKIETGFLNAYYSPRTELGIKRFNRERDELFN